MAKALHPTFLAPPINEVVCGVQFRRLVGMQAPHYGLFWELLRKEFPRTRTVAALNSVEVVSPNQPISITVEEAPLPRVWFISKDDSSLIQLQPDRLLFNWRSGENKLPYPRFVRVIKSFHSILNKFEKFVSDNELGDFSLQQAELSYVNRIERGQGWSSFADVGEIFPDFSWRRGSRLLGEPEAINYRSNHKYSGGTVNVAIQSVRLAQTNEQAIRFDLTARTAIAPEEEKRIWGWFDEANAYIVDAFVDLTSRNVQRDFWKRKT